MDAIEIDDDSILMPPPAPRVPLFRVQPEPTCSSSIHPLSDLATATSYVNSDASTTRDVKILSTTAVVKSLSSGVMATPPSGEGYFETDEDGEVDDDDGGSDEGIVGVSPDDFEKIDEDAVGDGGNVDHGKLNDMLNFKQRRDPSFSIFRNDNGAGVNATAEITMEQSSLFSRCANPSQLVHGTDNSNQHIPNSSFESIQIPLNAIEINESDDFKISAKNNDDNHNEDYQKNYSDEDIFHDARSGTPDTSKNNDSIGENIDSRSNDEASNPNMEECSATINVTNKKRKRPSRVYSDPTVRASFQDIIGHGAAKLRLDEALLPLALPPDLASAVLTGE